MKFGDNLKSLRKDQGLSQEELAEHLGVSRQSISKWECGVSYPTMENILILCELFHCKVNDMIHENLSDIKEVKESVMKLSIKKQRQMKGLSKVIFVLARIMKIVCFGSVVLLSVLFLACPFVASNIDYNGNHSFEIYGQTLEYERKENEILLKDDKGIYHLNNYNEVHSLSVLLDIFENHSFMKIVWFTEIALGVLIVTLVYLCLTFLHLEKLFVNFHNGETPFTLENVQHMKKMSIFMIVTVLIPSITGSICEFVFHFNLNIGFELMDFVYILFLYSLTYIFEYGYEIQRDSNGKLYDEERILQE